MKPVRLGGRPSPVLSICLLYRVVRSTSPSSLLVAAPLDEAEDASGGAEVPGSAGVPLTPGHRRGRSVASHTAFGARGVALQRRWRQDRPGPGDFLAVQWLGPGSVTAGSPGSIPGWGTKIPEVTWRGQKEHRWSLSQQRVHLVWKPGPGNISGLIDTQF